MYDPEKQFGLSLWNHLERMDFVDWYRFFFISKAVIKKRPETMLEIGPGAKVLVHMFSPLCKRYDTMDVNSNLSPTYVGDVRANNAELLNKYDCVVAADILEHIPFEDVLSALKNLHSYLRKDGIALITIPHRASYFLGMTPNYKPHVFRVPTGFLSIGSFIRRFIKRKIWIDPDHKWETGDGRHTIIDVENVMREAGFSHVKRKTLVYVDFWVLTK